jgi:hypothetical protein
MFQGECKNPTWAIIKRIANDRVWAAAVTASTLTFKLRIS